MQRGQLGAAAISVLLVLPAAGAEPDPLAVPPGARTSTVLPANNLYVKSSAAELARLLSDAHAAANSIPDRIERVTRGLLDAPYLRSPLGEGSGLDPDPRFRLDAFDCTTFVETALALIAEVDLPKAATVLDRIRYRSLPGTFITRRHLTETQWLPDLAREGWVRDITAEVGGKDVQPMRIDLNTKKWARRRVARSLTLPASAVPTGQFVVPVIPLEVAARGELKIPPGTIINVLRELVPWSPTMVTHQGIVLSPPGGGPLVVRHASPVRKRVVDEPLARMLRRYLHPRIPKKWKITGINLLAVLPPPNELAREPGAP